MTEMMILRYKKQTGLLFQHTDRGEVPDVFRDILELHDLFKCVISEYPQIPGQGTPQLRMNLISEEYNELREALIAGNITEIADAICDCIVVLLGTAVSYGIPFNACWREVHRTNMAKVGADGKPIFRADGKFLKPPGWLPPNIKSIIEKAISSHTNNAETERLNSLAHEDQQAQE